MENAPTVDIGRVIGPLFIGSILNWMLMGTLVMQLYTYYQTFSFDQLFLRILVNTLFVLDLAQTFVSTHFAWYFIVTMWGNASDFGVVPWSASMIPILCGIVAGTVQIFYAWRIWVLAPDQRLLKGMAVLIVLLALTQCTSAIVAGALVLRTPTQGELLVIKPEVTTWLSCSFIVDFFITASMTFILTQAKDQSGWGPSETVITALIHRVVQTGAASAVCAAIDLWMFVGYPGTNIHFVPAFILGKVYTNSLMLTLNLRRPLGKNQSSHDEPLTSLGSVRMYETWGTLDSETCPGGTWKKDQAAAQAAESEA
ncbi:hypothetical protein B0H17DRAFT_978399 [Mycena rosella]|uniref:DUF6534 domain-containing protein n=1 Tax=Mycena rosella TaxID=1033263 RepID=A0AAD7DSA3_MYCRO|nr:hypothetical protein B0H17DRAFT_978399 [Mycena rosella]